ncbi:TPA: hypothetical protein ACN322_004627 [Vibrio parahaemolyticus]
MSDKWNLIYSGYYEGRPIEVEQYDDDENCFKLVSTQKNDEDGSVSVNNSGILIMPPTEQGRKIAADCEGLDKLGELIIEFEFSSETQSQVIEQVGKALLL